MSDENIDVEIYSKDWCPYCSKAKALLLSKNIIFKEIDISNDADKELEMIKRSSRRTVPQIFINNKSVGGYDDLAQLNANGELNLLLGIESNQINNKVYDVAVIGAGPAGLSAAIYASRKNLSTIIISNDIGGQLGTTNEVANYPGFQLISGPDLAKQFTEHADQYNIEKMLGEKVVSVDFDGRCKVINTLSNKTIHAKTIIIASGAYKRRLNIPGEDLLAGKGVVYCSTCDGPLFKGLPVTIIGSGNSALEAAIEMNGMTDKVMIVSRGDWSGDPILQDKVNAAENIEVLKYHEPIEIVGEKEVEGIVIKNLISGRRIHLATKGVFIEVGLWPNSDFVLDLLETNEQGEIKVNAKGYTGVRGIFAAGDVTDTHNKQVIIAAGLGASAALGAFEYIISQV